MLKVKPGDRNLKYRIANRRDAYHKGEEEVWLKYPGDLTGGRWNYRDNPWDGIGQKERIDIMKFWNNLPPGIKIINHW